MSKNTWTVTSRKSELVKDENKGRELNTNHCHCGRYEATNDEGELRTDCPWLVGGQFKQGHDAKLKGLLIEAGITGAVIEERYAIGTGLTEIVTIELVNPDGRPRTQIERNVQFEWKMRIIGVGQAAGRYGFGQMVLNSIHNAGVKTARKAERKAARAQAEPTPTEVKIGRWWKTIASVDNAGVIWYEGKDGVRLQAKAGAQTR